MSAYIVPEETINVIVSYFIDYTRDGGLWHVVNGDYRYLNQDNAHELAWQLYNQNVRSVNDRYNDNNSDEVYSFEYVPRAKQLYTMADIAKALDGLEYQSCESRDYHQTEAWANLNMMRKHLLSTLEGYEESDCWSIDHEQTVERLAEVR